MKCCYSGSDPSHQRTLLTFISCFCQDSKYSSEVVTSPSLDVFLPEDEDNPYESVTTAVTRKPCSLDISRRLDACPGNGRTDRRRGHGSATRWPKEPPSLRQTPFSLLDAAAA